MANLNPTILLEKARTAGGRGDAQRTTSEDFTDGSPVFYTSAEDILVTKREGGTPGGSLDGVTLHFTIHSILLVGAPE